MNPITIDFKSRISRMTAFMAGKEGASKIETTVEILLVVIALLLIIYYY